MLKKTVSLLLVAFLCFAFLAGCGGGGDTAQPSGGGASPSNFTKPANPLDFDFSSVDWSTQPEVKLIWAIAQSASSAGGVNILDTFENCVEETGGKLKFELSADAVLVDEAGMLEALESGLCQIVKQTPSVNVGLIPELECMVFPGFFNGTAQGYDEFCRAIEGPIQAIYDDHGFKLFAINYTGVSGFLMKKIQVTKPEDLKGLLLRASGASLSKVIESYGASATVLGLGDVPSALDRGTIDGMFSAASMMVDFHFNEVAPYLTVLTFREMLGDYSMSQKWYDSLTPEMQAAIDYYGAKYYNIIIERVDINDQERFDDARAQGTNVLALTPEQSQPFADYAKPLFEDFGRRTSDKGRDLLKVIYQFNGWEWNF